MILMNIVQIAEVSDTTPLIRRSGLAQKRLPYSDSLSFNNKKDY